MGNTLLGGILGSDKPPEEVYSSQSQRALTEGANQSALDNLNSPYLAAYGNAISGQQPYLNSALSKWSDLADSIRSRPGNPLDNYKSLLDYTTGKIQGSVINPVITNLQNRLRQQQLARGINTGLDSTISRLQNAGIANNAYLQAYNSALGNAGPTANNLFQQQMARDQFNLGLTPQEFDLRNRYAAQNLLPMQAKTQAINDALAQAYQSAIAHKANVYGYHQPKNIWDKIDTGVGNVLNTAERVAAIYGQFYGGGMGGGGGGAKQQQQQVPSFQYQKPSQSQYDQGYARLYQSPPVDYNPSEGNAYYGGYA